MPTKERSPAPKFAKLTAVFVVTLLAVSACGHNAGQRAATGALGGLAVGGPIGAGVGAAGGALASHVLD